jgi:manganese/zinc/iron transport system permease protein
MNDDTPPQVWAPADFDFELPEDLIAQHPAAERSASRLLDGTEASPTGRVFRDLPTLLTGALVSALAAVGVLVVLRRVTRTRDDAATASVIGDSFGAGLALMAGITSRGLPGSAGLEHFLLGHTAALTARDAMLLGLASLVAVVLVAAAFKEAVLVAFDSAFAAATGWPVGLIDAALVARVAVMVVVGLPALRERVTDFVDLRPS